MCMSKLFINKTASYKKGGLRTPKISLKDFIKIVETRLQKEIHRSIPWCYDDIINLPELSYDLEKVDVGTDNSLFDNSGITRSGVPYGVLGCCDDCDPFTLYFVYWDGESLRGIFSSIRKRHIP